MAAEQAGFELAVASDHYSPWLDAQGHAPFVFATLGAVAQATELGILSDNRFTLGLGAGENLNEHITGGGWPPVNVRHEMLAEALDIICSLFGGEYGNYSGQHFQVDSAKLWDLGDTAPQIGIAVSGEQSCRLAGEHADVTIGTEPKA